MSIQIKYKNGIGSFITEQQLKGLKDYQKVTYNNGQVQLIERFRPIRTGIKKSVEYFMDETEVKADIIQESINAVLVDNSITRFVLEIYFNKQIANDCAAWDWEEYSIDNVLKSKGKVAYDNKDRLIFWCQFDLQTNALKSGAYKFYYGGVFENRNEDLLLKFMYYKNGEIELVSDYNDFLGLNDPVDKEDFTAYYDQFDLDEHPYYKSAYTILPTGDL